MHVRSLFLRHVEGNTKAGGGVSFLATCEWSADLFKIMCACVFLSETNYCKVRNISTGTGLYRESLNVNIEFIMYAASDVLV